MGQQSQLPLWGLGRALNSLPLLRCKPLGSRWLRPHPIARFLCLLLGRGAQPRASLLSGGRESPCEPCSLHVPDLQDDHQVEGGGARRKTQQHLQHAVQRLQHLQEERSRCALWLALSLQEAGFNPCHLTQNSATLRCSILPQDLPWLSPSSSQSELEKAYRTGWQALCSTASAYLIVERRVRAALLLLHGEKADVANAGAEVPLDLGSDLSAARRGNSCWMLAAGACLLPSGPCCGEALAQPGSGALASLQ